jgi:hypothetical protein
MPTEIENTISINPVGVGVGPQLVIDGDDAQLGLDIVAKGTAPVIRLLAVKDGVGSVGFLFNLLAATDTRMEHIPSAAATMLAAAGSAANLNIIFQPKGLTGRVRINSYSVPSILKADPTETGNVGAGPDVLFTYTMPGNTLYNVGDSLHIRSAGTVASNANSKQLKLIFGATTLFDTTAQLQNGGDWEFDALVMFRETGAQRATCRFTIGAAVMLWTSSIDYTAPAEGVGDVVIKVEATTATADNDLVGRLFIVEFLPGLT